jgi:hypothetical protein
MTMQLFDLAAIAVPVLLTYGVEDVAAPVGQGRWLASAHPNGRGVGEPDRRAPSGSSTCTATTLPASSNEPALRAGGHVNAVYIKGFGYSFRISVSTDS